MADPYAQFKDASDPYSQFKDADAGSVKAPPAAAPTKTSQALGFYQGLMKPIDNAAVGLEAGLKRVGVDTDKINSFFGTSSAQSAKQSHADYVSQMATRGIAPGGVGRFAGETVGTLPIAALTSNPIVAGAASGALLSDAQDASDLGKDAVIGGVGGKLGDIVVRGATRVISPAVSPYVKKLLDAGVRLTPGQILGGGFKGAEDAMRSVPVVGDVIGSAQNTSIQDFNRAAANRALVPFGKAVPSGIAAGHDLATHLNDTLGAEYKSVLPHLSFTQDQKFLADLAAAKAKTLTPGYAGQLQDIITRQIDQKVPVGSSVSGNDLKGIGEELGTEATGYSADPSFDARKLGGSLADVNTAFKSALSRQNQSHADRLMDINTGYANFARLRDAGSRVGAKEGVFTPAQLNSAVRSGDKSAGKGQFSRGDALMQDLATAGDQVISSKVPDSGTVRRGLTAGIAGGVAGLSAVFAPKTLAVALGGMAAYSPQGMKALEIALTRRPQAAQAIADLIRKGNRVGALATANALVGLSTAKATP